MVGSFPQACRFCSADYDSLAIRHDILPIGPKTGKEMVTR